MRGRHTITLAAVATSMGMLGAGCGGNSPSAGTTQTKSGVQAAYAYAHCMREHGVTGYPDPHVSTDGGETRISQMAPGNVVATPAFRSASKACASLEPGPQGAGSSARHGPGKLVLLAFARCLRSRGISNFPDPTAQGQLTLEMIHAAGINLHAPGFFATARRCLGVTHGQITTAQLGAAINGPH